MPRLISITYEGEVREIEASEPRPASGTFSAPKNIRYRIPKAEYIEKIKQCIEWIRQGESYEMCLTNQLLLESDIDPALYFSRLDPAPFSVYADLGDQQICCASPECFLRIDSDGNVQSRPIKGTIASSRDPAELTTNPRYRAENLMIVDLIRNDLSRVCIPGSVRAPRLMEVETYPTVHQLVSTIEGKLKPGLTAMDCIAAAFPGGSMTGAPKKRTMELLRELEGEPRGIYSGAIGILHPDGSAVFNIVIRTAVFRGNQVSIGAGGAIVAHSDPEEEWEELELKASALLQAFMPDE